MGMISRRAMCGYALLGAAQAARDYLKVGLVAGQVHPLGIPRHLLHGLLHRVEAMLRDQRLEHRPVAIIHRPQHDGVGAGRTAEEVLKVKPVKHAQRQPQLCAPPDGQARVDECGVGHPTVDQLWRGYTRFRLFF